MATVRLDIIKTNFSDETPSLYHNEGKGFFADVTIPAGLGSETTSVKWGTGFMDFNDDGRPDILIASGLIYPPGTGLHHQLPKTESKLILLHNIDGNRFENISGRAGPVFADSRCSRGMAFGDIFNTGRTDVVINNLNDYPCPAAQSISAGELPAAGEVAGNQNEPGCDRLACGRRR